MTTIRETDSTVSYRNDAGQVVIERAYQSPSSVSLAGTCRHQYLHRYGLATEPDPGCTVPRDVGTLVHQWLAEAARNFQLFGIEPGPELVKEMATADYAPEVVAEAAQLLADSLTQISFEFTVDGGMEQEWELEVGDTRLRGVIDRVDFFYDEHLEQDVVEVVDYKTGGRVPTLEELKDDPQVALYLAAAEKKYGGQGIIQARWHYIRREQTMMLGYDEWHVASMLGYARALDRSLAEEREWRGTVGAHCRWCDYRSKCAYYADHLNSLTADVVAVRGMVEEMGWPDIVSERERLKDIAKLAEARRQELDKLLLDHLESINEKSANYGGMTVTRTQRKSRSFPNQDALLHALASASGQDWHEIRRAIVDVGSTRLKKWLRTVGKDQRAKVQEAIDRHVDVGASFHIRVKK